MSVHEAVAAALETHASALRRAAADRPPAPATAGLPYQPGDLVVDRVTGQELRVIHGSRQAVLAPNSGE